jgi:hypothetical protein
MIDLMDARRVGSVQKNIRLVLVQFDADAPVKLALAQVANKRRQIDVSRIQILVDRTGFGFALLHDSFGNNSGIAAESNKKWRKW